MFPVTEQQHLGEQRRIRMIMLGFLLLLLISLSEQDGQQAGVSQCGAQNLTISTSDPVVLVQWEDDPSCLALNKPILYQMSVLIENKEVFSEEVSLAPEDIGSPHSWRWTSPLPWECGSHTFSLKSKINNQTSRLEQNKTRHAGSPSGGEVVHPQDAVLEFGSTAIFCCIVPAGKRFDKMYLSRPPGRNIRTAKISEQRYAGAVRLDLEGNMDILCQTKEEPNPHGSTVHIGYKPDVSDLECETRDLESVDCIWKKRRGTMVEHKTQTTYQLNGSPCEHPEKGRCSRKFPVEAGAKNWTLTVYNKLGEVELYDLADLTRRVHMLAPYGLKVVDVKARNISLNWEWTVRRYSHLNLTCQIDAADTEGHLRSEHGVGMNAAVLDNLTPKWTYEVKVRCRTAQHSWKWGNWSQSLTVKTKGDVPDALDVWMEKEGNRTVVVWKIPLKNQSHGHISGYDVARTSDPSQPSQTAVEPSKGRYPLPSDAGREHVVVVTARNEHGSSPPSSITVPVISPNETSLNNVSITGSNGGFDLSWCSSPVATCGYIVDWFPVRGGRVDWCKLPPSQTSVRITSGNLEDGKRYSVSIYACTGTSPLLLQKTEAYVRETEIKGSLFEPLKYEQRGSNVEIRWQPLRLREQSAFIRGYVLYYQREAGQRLNVTTDDPERTSLTAQNLKSGSYSFMVAAKTAAGECGNTWMTATFNFQTESYFQTFFIALGAVFILLFLISVFCYRYYSCIKKKVYPRIPNPDVADWFLSPVKNIPASLQADPSLRAEEHVDVPQLLYTSGEPLNNSQQDHVLLTPNTYKNIPAALDHQSASLLSVLPNASYNLPMPDVDPTPSSEPRLDYQPQPLIDIFHQDGSGQVPVCFVSEYIMAPSSQ